MIIWKIYNKFVFAMQTSVRAKESEKMYFVSIGIKAELIKVQKSIKY